MMDKTPSNVSKLRALQALFVKELPSRLENIQQMWNGGEMIDHDEFHRLVHSLSGAAGTFGFKLLGDIAYEIELLIKQQKDSLASPKLTSAVDQCLLKLHEIADKGPDNMKLLEEALPVPTKPDDETPSLIYILEDDVNLAKEAQLQLQHFGYNAEVFHSTKAFHAGVAKQMPDAVLSDIHLPEGTDGGPRAIAEFRRKSNIDVPVIFVSNHSGWEDRLNAVRAGGQAYLSKPINFSLLVEQLDAITGKTEESHFRILIVDDTPLLAQRYAAALEAADMQTEVMNSPEKILDVLAVFRPDLILMDLYMPGCTGIEAAQVVRQHTGYANTPIVYLSTEKELDLQLKALNIGGGDDFLQKPISDTHLVAAVRNRARRFKELSTLMNRDGLTGLLNHINLKLALEREISQVQRRDTALSFVMIDIDNFKSVNDTYGHPVGDQVIKSLARLLTQRLRKSDIAARYGGEEFAVILADTTIEDAYRLIDDLRQQFSKINYSHNKGDFNVTLSAGIAVCYSDTDVESILIAADSALYGAKHGGRNQVVIETKKSSEKK